MSDSTSADEQDALATLRMLREQIEVSELTAEDRADLIAWWNGVDASGDKLEPEPFSFAGLSGAAMLYDPNQEGLAPHLIPTSLAFRAFDTAIGLGVPGAEHEAEEFLSQCGFDRDAARQIILRMASRAPQPDPEALN